MEKTNIMVGWQRTPPLQRYSHWVTFLGWAEGQERRGLRPNACVCVCVCDVLGCRTHLGARGGRRGWFWARPGPGKQFVVKYTLTMSRFHCEEISPIVVFLCQTTFL